MTEKKPTNQQILTKAIRKAIDGGWYSFAGDLFGKITIDDILLRHNPHGQGLEWTVKGHESNWSLIEALIYSHDFAKALWGEEKGYMVTDTAGCQSFSTEETVNSFINQGGHFVNELLPVTLWQYHLQQMVIAEDPIAYLGENI